MLDISYIRDHAEAIKENCHIRHVSVDVEELLSCDDERRQLIQTIDALRAKRKLSSKSKVGEEERMELRQLGGEIKEQEDQLMIINKNYEELLSRIPNLTHPDVPIGGEEDYKVLEEKGSGLVFDFTPQDHEALLTARDLIDFERGAKIAGAKFFYAKRDLVRLNQALINYGMDVVTRHGYELLETPDVAKQSMIGGTGYQPRGPETQVYSLEGTELGLIATAEITLAGYHANEILDLSLGPRRYTGLSHCFRTEAGAYGRTSKGLYRVHQFSKLEMFVLCQPGESETLHQELLAIEKEICDGLGLQYRVIDTPSGDLGGPAYRKFDIEARLVMKDFGEITSTSNCTDYQARRLNIKYRRPDGSNDFVHMLNGTAVVLSRFPLAIVEQYQQADGSIQVPGVLRAYMKKEYI